MASDFSQHMDRAYRQVLDLLEELVSLHVNAGEEEEAAEHDEEAVVSEEDILNAIIEEAGERGLDEEQTERLFKAIAAFAKKGAEG